MERRPHLLERSPDIAELVAIDRDRDRLARVSDNLDRIGLDATLLCADAGDPDDWWDGAPFDRVLVDAPCSGTGVIRRNPDIKQAAPTGRHRFLRHGAVAPARGALAAGGPGREPRVRYLHVPAAGENDHVLAEFLAKHPDAGCGPMEQAWGRPTRHGRQILPGENTMDGFYYALLGKH